jgi:hypothetical protein
MMSIWIPLVVLATALFVMAPLGEHWGLHPIAAASLATATAASALTALITTWLAPSLFPEPSLPTWLILLGPAALMALEGAGGATIHAKKKPAAIGHCAHCGLPMFADHTGRRYVADGVGYLCPPEFRHQGHRRHRLAPPGSVRPVPHDHAL